MVQLVGTESLLYVYVLHSGPIENKYMKILFSNKEMAELFLLYSRPKMYILLLLLTFIIILKNLKYYQYLNYLFYCNI